jgi:hypothetical protein
MGRFAFARALPKQVTYSIPKTIGRKPPNLALFLNFRPFDYTFEGVVPNTPCQSVQIGTTGQTFQTAYPY